MDLIINRMFNLFSYRSVHDSLAVRFLLQHNVMVFIAELFWWFEIVKPEFVQPRDVQEFKDGEILFIIIFYFFCCTFVILLSLLLFVIIHVVILLSYYYST